MFLNRIKVQNLAAGHFEKISKITPKMKMMVRTYAIFEQNILCTPYQC